MEAVFLLGVVVAVYVLVAPALGVAAFFRLRAVARRLEARLAVLEGGDGAAAVAPAAASMAQPRRGWPTAEDWAARRPENEVGAAVPPSGEPETGTPETPEAVFGEPAVAGASRTSFEERLTARWLVWLGAGTMALAAVFLVRYALERGLLGPDARVVAGLLLGTALAASGEWLRRRPSSRAIAARGRDFVPAALTGSGLFTLFASVYAASALYGLIGPGVAYLALSVIALGGVALALLHGPFVALLGLLGGYATPLLVESAAPLAWPVFLFLAMLTGAVACLVRWTGLAWLGWAALVGAVGWALFWLDGVFVAGDAGVLGAYLLAIAAAGLLATPIDPTVSSRWAWLQGGRLLALAWAVAVAFALLVLADMDGRGAASLLAIAGFAAGGLAAGRLLMGREVLLLPALVLVAALLALWPLPGPSSPVLLPPDGPWREPWLPVVLQSFVVTAVLHAGLFGVVGFLALRRAARPAFWAGVSAGMPVVVFALAYRQLGDFAVDLRWTPVALGLAGLALVAVALVQRRGDEAWRDDVVALYAAAVTASLALAATTVLREAWLTVALALELPALGWIALRLGNARLRQLAGVLALVVIARLVLNPFVLDYALGNAPAVGWVLYGYGLPALAFVAAARLFRRRADDGLVALLEGGAILFAVLLVTLEIQLLVAGSITGWPDHLLALGLQSSAWLTLALVLTRERPWFARPEVVWGRRVLAGAALVQALALQVLLFNPLWRVVEVGEVPLLNLLLPAYALPAVLAAWYGRRETRAWLAVASSVTGLVLAFVYVTLAVRQCFHGSRLDQGAASNAEWFSYSAAWLGFAAALLAAGILRRSTALRWASLVIVMATIGKVFLFDTADLEGLWRVASFLGLGLSLVAIGFIYQRLVFPIGARAKPPTSP